MMLINVSICVTQYTCVCATVIYVQLNWFYFLHKLSFHPGICLPVTQGQIRKCVKWISAQKAVIHLFLEKHEGILPEKERHKLQKNTSSFELVYWATASVQVLTRLLAVACRCFFEGSYTCTNAVRFRLAVWAYGHIYLTVMAALAFCDTVLLYWFIGRLPHKEKMKIERNGFYFVSNTLKWSFWKYKILYKLRFF